MSRWLHVAAICAAILAVPLVASSQDLTTLLAIFLRNLHAGRIVIPVQTAFASLPSSTDGTIAYCSDCLEGSDPASGSSTGAFVLRVNGRWAALDGGSAAGAPTDAQYWTGAADGTLSAEKNLGALSTALVLNTAGVPSAYAGIDCTNQFPRDVSGAGAGTCASVVLTADVTGVLPEANGGTNQSTYAQGDVLYASASNTLSKLTKGTAGQFLKMNAGATVPEWGVQHILIYAGAGDTSGYNPAAGSSFYFSIQTGLDPNTTDGGPRIPIPISGTINYAEVAQSTLGTNGVNGENIVYKLRKNATTDSSTVATLDTDADNVSGSNSSLGFAVSAGDFIAIKATPPAAWTTPPTIMFWSVVMRLDVP